MLICVRKQSLLMTSFCCCRRDFLPISTTKSSPIDQFKICVPTVPRITPNQRLNFRLGKTGTASSEHRVCRMVWLNLIYYYKQISLQKRACGSVVRRQASNFRVIGSNPDVGTGCCMLCTWTKHLVHIFSVHAPSLKRVPTIAGNEPVMDCCSFQAGVSNNQLLSTTNYVL